MYELIILAHLMRQSAHGYLIAKIINDIIGPYARISNGRLYPLLSKLKEQGLIETSIDTHCGHGDRQLCSYRITEAGKSRFQELMLDTGMNPGEYQRIFLQKACFLDLLTPQERLRLIDHYSNYCHTHILHLTTEAEDIVRQSPSWEPGWSLKQSASIVEVLRHSIRHWELELQWVNSLREKESAQGSLGEDLAGEAR